MALSDVMEPNSLVCMSVPESEGMRGLVSPDAIKTGSPAEHDSH